MSVCCVFKDNVSNNQQYVILVVRLLGTESIYGSRSMYRYTPTIYTKKVNRVSVTQSPTSESSTNSTQFLRSLSAACDCISGLYICRLS